MGNYYLDVCITPRCTAGFGRGLTALRHCKYGFSIPMYSSTNSVFSSRKVGIGAVAKCKSAKNNVNLLRSSTGALQRSSHRAGRQRSITRRTLELAASASMACAMSAHDTADKPHSTRPDLQDVREQPKKITDGDLMLLSEYTRSKDLDALRQHVYRVQKSAQDSVCTTPVMTLRRIHTMR